MEKNPIEIYRSADGNIELNVKLENDTVWLTQSQMAKLFGKDQSVIARHIANAFKEEEVTEESNMQILHNTQYKFRSEKNRYIEEEKEVLAEHRTKMLKMLEEHEQNTRHIIRQGEGIWLSDFWMKFLVGTIYSVIGLLALALWLK